MIQENMSKEGEKKAPSVRKCPYCGDLIPPLTNVCPSCGQIVEDQNGDSDVNTMMANIDRVCNDSSGSSIRVYDYILLLIPIIYLVWVVVVIMKIRKSNRLYDEFHSLCSKAQNLYGDNHKFHEYLTSKTIEMEGQKKKSKTSHMIVYVLLFVDLLLLCGSLVS